MKSFDGKYGGLYLPAIEQPQDTDEIQGFFGEPGLELMGEYFKYCLNKYLSKGYQSRAFDEPNVVQFLYGWSPLDAQDDGEGYYNGSQTPALYIFRGEHREFEDMADDERVAISRVDVLWVPPKDGAEQLANRFQFINAIIKTLDMVIDRQREPGFVIEGDPDTKADDWGSHVWRACGFDKIYIRRAGRAQVRVRDSEGDGSWRAMAAHIELVVHERVSPNNTSSTNMYDALNGLDAKVSEGTVDNFPEHLHRIL